ncbi:MAG TPA: ABC transporter permease [Actinophytocola sp.]|jgi:hypothetical protein|uniref:ABC transporter permease n=1 Tax=Actinophytocola sp. TaxID=1872138 RepID=UPI002F9203B7
MVWLTVRQHRMQLVVTSGLLVAFGVLLLVNALVTRHAIAGLSGEALDEVLPDRVYGLRLLVTFLPAASALVGLFWGAPLLAREVERGTHVLAWTQSVSRSRWFSRKLAVLAVAVTLCGLAVGAMVDAWLDTFAGTPYADRFANYGVFAGSGVAAAGWWLFGFTLGVAAGALLRRLLPAMAATLAVFVLALLVVFALREHYATPVRVVISVGQVTPRAVEEGMVVASGCLDAAGTETALSASPAYLSSAVTPPACPTGSREVTYYQPAGRYWRFQWTEAGILLVGASLSAGVAYQRVARRAL